MGRGRGVRQKHFVTEKWDKFLIWCCYTAEVPTEGKPLETVRCRAVAFSHRAEATVLMINERADGGGVLPCFEIGFREDSAAVGELGFRFNPG